VIVVINDDDKDNLEGELIKYLKNKVVISIWKYAKKW